MKQARVRVHWKEGLHLRHAARLVRRARSFRSSISLQVDERITDARSILGLLLLCATLGTLVDLRVSGEDEDAAIVALASLFESADPNDASVSPRHGDPT